MLLRSVTFEDFGIYAGCQTFDLTPDTSGQFDRPIVLFSGKNGVGKTTFVEGIRLCLHGPVALGSRVAQQEYETHLLGRIHHPLARNGAEAQQPGKAAVEVVFDFTSLGKKITYRVRRQWAAQNRRLSHDVHIWENGELLDVLTNDERETLLRELVPPGLAAIFFFDGEKISALADDSGDSLLFAETVNALLGLNLIDQLQRDLDVFLARYSPVSGRNGAHRELDRLATTQADMEQRRNALSEQVEDLKQNMDEVRRQIAVQEARIAAEGGSYASRRAALLERRLHIDADTESLRRRVVDMANGLFPFAVAPEMLRAVHKRLELETTFQEQQAARQLIDRQLDNLEQQMQKATFWSDAAEHVTLPVREKIFYQVAENLRSAVLTAEIDAAEVILHVSDKERSQLSHWIDEALAETPLAFGRLMQQVSALEREKAGLDADLERAPADELLAPLVARLHTLLRQLGGLEQTQEQLQEEIRLLDYALEQTGFAVRRARAAIEQAESAGRRAGLTARTQAVLDEYKAELTRRKLALLEHSLVSHFNQLCRKHAFLDRITVDRATLALTLHRAGHAFTRDQLSAGENQLLAIAMLWALRELSGRATPVIIDTPLSRLDSQHRQSMLHDFLPRASHQVVLLATDAEIDAAAVKRLAPVIARVYRMEYDPATGAATHTQETPPVVTPNLTLFDQAPSPEAMGFPVR